MTEQEPDIFAIIGTELPVCPKCGREGKPKVQHVDIKNQIVASVIIIGCGLTKHVTPDGANVGEIDRCHYAPPGYEVYYSVSGVVARIEPL